MWLVQSLSPCVHTHVAEGEERALEGRRILGVDARAVWLVLRDVLDHALTLPLRGGKRVTSSVRDMRTDSMGWTPVYPHP